MPTVPPLSDDALCAAAAELIAAAAAGSREIAQALALVDAGRGSLQLEVTVTPSRSVTSLVFLPEHRRGRGSSC
jgi:uncharacterized protein YsxB (DUF464 family)